VQYFVWARGRPIGTTDLGFVRFDGSSWSGWFHPNALGEQLMPIVGMALPAMRAFVCRNVRDVDGRSIVQPDFCRSSLFADLAEAFHRIEALDLTLHRADGTLICTTMIGIQDTEQLLEHSLGDDPWPEPDPCVTKADESDARGWEPAQDSTEHDFDLPQSTWRECDDDELDVAEWVLSEEAIVYPRYQAHVLFAEESAIP
jgi:hypothetical protein